MTRKKHPIVAITGASGAGTTIVQQAFREIFYRQNIKATFVHGDSFFRYDQAEMCVKIAEAEQQGRVISTYGPELNDFDALQDLFRQYSETGSGRIRHLVTEDNADQYPQLIGTFTEWEDIAQDNELLFYEGLHGGVVSDNWTRRKMSPSHNPQVIQERRKRSGKNAIDVARYVDLLIGVVPAINLEWIQKIHNEKRCRNLSPEEVTASILGRLQDYIHFIVPQFSVTDINFQRMPVVDTSNPFVARDVPTETESIVVVRFREPEKYDFPHFLKRIHNSFMSRRNTLVIPGGEMKNALDVICAPMIERCCGR